MKNLLKCLLSDFVLLTLSACGGGGGGGGGTTTPTARTLLTVGTAQAAVAKGAAEATPRKGSVTQSVRTASVGGVSNVTQDQVTASYDGSNRVTVTNSGSGARWNSVAEGSTTHTLRSLQLQGTNTEAGNVAIVEKLLQRNLPNGDIVLVDTFTDRADTTDTDYLAGGVWAVIPASGSGRDYEAGAFADAQGWSATPTSYLKAEKANAIFEGDATGIYYLDNPSSASVGEFVGDVQLTLDFGTTPSISGMVDNISEIGVSRGTDTLVALDAMLTLSSANLADEAGGFFTGDTAGTQTIGGTERTYAGKWGGQVFGANADLTVGTFGGHSSNTDDKVTFVGAFGATKQ